MVKCGDGRESFDVGCCLYFGVLCFDDFVFVNNGVGCGFSVVCEEYVFYILVDVVLYG